MLSIASYHHLCRYTLCQQCKKKNVWTTHKVSHRSYTRHAVRVLEQKNTRDVRNTTDGGYSPKILMTNLTGTRYEIESVQAIRTTVLQTPKLIYFIAKPRPHLPSEALFNVHVESPYLAASANSVRRNLFMERTKQLTN